MDWWHWRNPSWFRNQDVNGAVYETFCFLGVSEMRRFIVTLSIVACAAVSSTANAGLFHKKDACCEPAPVCCEAPAPTCCEAAPVCRPKLQLGSKLKGILANLHSKLHSSKCCEPAPTCCDAPAPCAAPAPAPCAAPAPTSCDAAPSCGCEVAAPSCKPARKHHLKAILARIKAKHACCKPAPSCCEPAPTCCEAPAPCCKPARKHCLKDMIGGLKGKLASMKRCAPAPSCGCEVAPSCGCN